MSHIEVSEDRVLRRKVIKIIIDDFDCLAANLTNFDKVLLAECNRPDATAADRVLGVEVLVRRIEETKA